MKRILNAKILFSLVLAFALFAGILAATVHAADPTFRSVGITTGESLKEYLELDGNFIINVSADIHTWIGEPGDSSYWPPDVPYWCTLGSGIKVLDLHGFDVKLSYDKSNANEVEDSWDIIDTEYKEIYCTPMTMFRVPTGAELVINDDGNTGEINYDAYMRIEFSGIGDTFLENRNLIEVDGGRLTVNGGKLFAGRSKKFYSYYHAENYYAQINGTAIILKNGDAVINGGDLHGRGYVRINQYTDDIRDAAIKATGGNLTIYDGEFWGKGCADVLQISDAVNITVYGGSFNTHKQEQGIVFSMLGTADELGLTYGNTSYGKIGLPARAFQNVGTRTDVKVSGTGVLTAEQAAADATLNTSKDVEVYPVSMQSGAISQYTGSAYTKLAAGTTIEWDKVSNLNLLFNHDSYYPQNLTGVYAVYGHDSGETYAQICNLPNGCSEIVKVGPVSSGSSIVNLLNMSDDLKSKLEVGKTYYLTMYNIEKWTTPNDTYEILYNAHKQKIKIKIVEPVLTMPDLDFGLTWENRLSSSGNNWAYVTPTGDASSAGIQRLMDAGKITRCALTYYYYNELNEWSSLSVDTDTQGISSVGGTLYFSLYRGVSPMKLMMEVWQGDSFLGRKEITADVLRFPNITADRTVDQYGRILVSPDANSDHWVTLSCNANGTTGLFWAKDGTKLSDSNKQKNYSVNVTGADKMGWYSLGYTVGNQQYISDQKIYLGVDGGSAKSLTLSASANSYKLEADGDAMPTLTALASGSDLGPIKQYQWQNVSWPEGARPKAIRTSTTGKTVSIASVFGAPGYETQYFVEGMYVFSCTAYDSYDQPVTSNTVSVYVYRPAQGLQLWHDSVTDSWHEIPYTSGEHQDVTNKFIVLYDEDDTDYLSAVFTPQNATTSSVAFNAMSDAVTVDNSGRIQARSAGSATITATTGNGLSASTKVLVPKTKYDVTIPEAWLKVEAGATVHRGTVPTTYADYSVELNWEARGSSDWYDYNDATFAGNRIYHPVVKIRPKAGVCYPVNVEYRGSNSFMYFADDNDRYVITVNGVEYFGVDYCGQQRSYYYDSEPVSKGGTDDFLRLYLTPTEKIIDWRDEYITHAAIEIDVPKPGDPKDASPDWDKLLDVRFITEGLLKTVYSNEVKHVTDLSTINDQNTSNDALEDFETYKEGETYRYNIGIIVDSTAATPNGGRYYFADNVKMVEPELGAITNTAALEYGILYGYVYFTVNPDASGFGVASTLSGTVTSYGDEAGTVTIKLIPKGATEAAYSLTVRGNSAAYSIEDVAPGAYVLEVSKSKHATREYNITVGDDDVVKDLEILLYGDVTGEGSITTADVTQIKRYINGKTSKFDQGDAEIKAYLLKVANVTTADSLTTADVTQIKRYINGKSSIFDNLP